MYSTFLWSVCLTLISYAARCGAGNDGPTLYLVKGSVLKGPAPLKAVSVMLVPVDAKKGITVTTISADDGSFEFATPQGKKGVPVGSYKVVLSVPPTMDYSNTSKSRPKEDTSIPKEFTSADTSPKTFDVKAGADNVLTLELW